MAVFAPRNDARVASYFAAQYYAFVPEFSRFWGILIQMFAEVGAPYHVPRFHAYYQEQVEIFSIEPIEMISGLLPRGRSKH